MVNASIAKRVLPIIRVFVSSTFSDLKLERDALQQRVFPKLEQMCLRDGFQNQVIDLRWGVSTEAGLDHRTMRICFEELRRSQALSPEPNFLILLGNRYGWRPLPEEISAEEYRLLENAAAKLEAEGQQPSPVDVLHRWYRLDENSRTPVHILQPRHKPKNDEPDYTAIEVWQEVEQVLWRIINRAIPPEGLQSRFANPSTTGSLSSVVRFQASATEQEIWHGALNVPNAERHVLAFFRDITNREAISDAAAVKDFFDLTESGTLDTNAEMNQAALKEAITQRLGNNAVELPAVHLIPGQATITTDHIDELCQEVESRLAAIIKQQIEEYWQSQAAENTVSKPSTDARTARELEIERDEHRRFGEERGPIATFVGRAESLQRILAYVENDSQCPLVIHGDSGCGKTALLARAFQEIPSDKGPMIRFLGVTPHSSDLGPLLRSLCQELRERHPFAVPLSSDVRELSQEFRQHLEGATAEEPIVLFLDALDQLSDADNARQLFWIPFGLLPSHVKIVVSCLSDRDENDPVGQPFEALQQRELPPENIVHLDALPLEDAKTLLFNRWLRAAGRTVNEAQRRLLEGRLESIATCRQPLYLKLLYEEAKLWRSYDEPTQPGDSVPALLTQLCERLSEPELHGASLVRFVLGYIAAARRGLSETEILEVLFADPDYKRELEEASHRNKHILPTEPPRIPIAIWSRLHSDLAPYLAERAAPGGNVRTLYHQVVAEWVIGNFVDKADWNPHKRLAAFFGKQDYFLQSISDKHTDKQQLQTNSQETTPNVDEQSYECADASEQTYPNYRKCTELPWALVQSSQWPTLADVLSDPRFFTVAYRFDKFQLFAYWTKLEGASSYRCADGFRAVLESPAEFSEELIWNLANFFETRGEVDAAETLRAHQINRYAQGDKLQDQLSLALVLGRTAEDQAARGDTESAFATLERAEQLAGKVGAAAGVAAVLGNRANILGDLDRLEEALQVYKHQERFCREHGLHDDLVRCLGDQELVLAALGYLHQAHQRLRELTELGETLNQPDTKVDALTRQADLAKRVNRVEDALAYAQQACQVATDYGLAPRITNVERLIQELAHSAPRPGVGPNLSQPNEFDWFTCTEQEIRTVLEALEGVSLRDRNGRTPLMGAAYHGYFKLMMDLLKRMPSAQLCDPEGHTALYFAEHHQPHHRQIAEILRAEEARAVQQLADERARQLSNSVPSSSVQAALTTRLLTAVNQDETDEVASLLDQGADGNAGDQKGFTPLMVAAVAGHKDIVALFLGHRVDVNVRATTGTTALMLAADTGREKIVQMLLEAGADVNAQDLNEWSSLMMAARKNYLGVVRRLVEAHVDVDARNIDGSTAILYAVEEGHTDCVRLLLPQKPDLVSPNRLGTNALGLAADRGFLDIVGLLLDAGVDVNIANSVNGMTPLHFAAQNGCAEIVHLLLKRGANPTARNVDDITPRIYAIRKGNRVILEMLASPEERMSNRGLARTNPRPSKAVSQKPITTKKPCKACGKMNERIELTCPHCGNTQWGFILFHLVIALVCFAVVIIAFFLAPHWIWIVVVSWFFGIGGLVIVGTTIVNIGKALRGRKRKCK